MNKRLVSRIIRSSEGPFFYDSDMTFNKLQQEFPLLIDEYGYDDFNSWRRAAQRVFSLLDRPGIRVQGLKILDAGCGDGMLGVLLNSYGHITTLVDAEDWRNSRARSLDFLKADLCDLSLITDNKFDLVCSYNAFEHIHDPQAGFNEILRVCKLGGLIYLEFGPLYYGPWGLHAYRTIRMPYPQLLFSEEFIQAKICDLKIKDLGKTSTELQSLNKWRYHDFCSLWRDNPSCEILFKRRTSEDNYLDVIRKYPKAFQNRGLSLLDLSTQSIRVLIRKSSNRNLNTVNEIPRMQ